MAWSQAEDATTTRADYLPRIRRKDAFRLGYLARRSGHSLGTTVDVTLVALGSVAAPPRTQGPACHLPAGRATGAGELDLGTGFDCFDPLAHTYNPNVAPEARALRLLLSQTMRQAGFVGYVREWWHFTLAGTNTRQKGYDVPIR